MSEPLSWLPATDHSYLLAPAVARTVSELAVRGLRLEIAPVDPLAADTDDFCARYGHPLDRAVNCLVVSGRRGNDRRWAVCLAPASRRVDLKGVVCDRLEVRRISLVPMKEIFATGMVPGSVTPLGLPRGWPVLLDSALCDRTGLVIGGGLRSAKLRCDGRLLASLPGVQVVDDLVRSTT